MSPYLCRPLSATEDLAMRSKFATRPKVSTPGDSRGESVAAPPRDSLVTRCRYLAGGSLADLDSDETLSEAAGKAVACRILRAIQLLHARGFAHSDVKPANVALAEQGRFKTATLIDLGAFLKLGTPPPVGYSAGTLVLPCCLLLTALANFSWHTVARLAAVWAGSRF